MSSIAAGFELLDDKAAEEPGSAGDEDSIGVCDGHASLAAGHARR